MCQKQVWGAGTSNRLNHFSPDLIQYMQIVCVIHHVTAGKDPRFRFMCLFAQKSDWYHRYVSISNIKSSQWCLTSTSYKQLLRIKCFNLAPNYMTRFPCWHVFAEAHPNIREPTVYATLPSYSIGHCAILCGAADICTSYNINVATSSCELVTLNYTCNTAEATNAFNHYIKVNINWPLTWNRFNPCMDQ